MTGIRCRWAKRSAERICRTYSIVTFSGAGVVGNSIADGVYDITLNHAGVTDALSQTLAADRVDTFFRMYGNTTGYNSSSGTASVAATISSRAAVSRAGSNPMKFPVDASISSGWSSPNLPSGPGYRK